MLISEPLKQQFLNALRGPGATGGHICFCMRAPTEVAFSEVAFQWRQSPSLPSDSAGRWGTVPIAVSDLHCHTSCLVVLSPAAFSAFSWNCSTAAFFSVFFAALLVAAFTAALAAFAAASALACCTAACFDAFFSTSTAALSAIVDAHLAATAALSFFS